MTRTVKLEIDAKVSGLVNGLKTASQATKDSAREFDKWSQQHEQSLDTVSKGMMGFGAVVGGGAVLAVKKFAEFDKAMSGVQASSHATASDMGLLRQAAIDAGADTAFSAKEAAGGIEELAKAGVSTQDVIGGGLTGALDLAAAGQLSVADAAEISASALTQFKLSGEDIPHLADLLAAGAGKAQGSVHDLGEALNQSGLVASATGLTIEETTGGLAAFASAGLTGSDAGTSFKTMLQRLTPQSKEAQKKFDELGISAYDAQGNFVGLTDFAGQLQEKMAGLTPEARNAAMSVMFGSDAVRASNVLYEQGAKGIQGWIDQVNDAGYAADTAALLQNNLAGDLEKLGGSFDTVFLKSGGAANEVLRDFVQTAEKVVDVIGQIPAPILGMGTMFAGVAGGAALLAGAAINVLPKIRDTKDALKDLGVIGKNSGKQVSSASGSFVTIDAAMSKSERSARKLGGALKTIGAGAVTLAAVGPAIGSMVPSGSLENIDKLTAGLLDVSKTPDVINAAFTGKGNWFDGLDVKGFEDAIGVIANPSWSDKADQNISKVLSFGTRSSSNWEFAKKNVDQLDGALADMAKNGNADSAAESYRVLSEMAANAGTSTEALAELFPQYSGALQLADSESRKAAEGTGQLGDALAGTGEVAAETAKSLDDILASVFELGRESRTVSESQDALTGSLSALNASIAENGAKFTGNSEAALKNREALRAVAEDSETLAEAQARAGASSSEIQSGMQTTYDALMKATGGSEALVRELMGIPKDVSVKSWMEDSAKQIAEATANAIEQIPGYTKVGIAVSEDGTVGQVQSKINAITGKTEYIFVTDDGTVTNVQAGIARIKGKDVPVYVGDDGTVYSTQGKILNIKGKDVTITAVPQTGGAEEALNRLARPRFSSVTVTQNFVPGSAPPGAGVAKTFLGRNAEGGRLPNRATGGRLPYTGLGTDMILGIGSDGMPTARVDDGEWVIREKSASKYDRLLGLINRDDPSVQGLAGLASGGRVGSAQSKVDRLQRQFSLMPGDKKNKARKAALKADLYDAKYELKQLKAEVSATKKSSASAKKASDKAAKDAKKKADDAKKKAAEAAKLERERVARVNEERFDLRRDLKRGEITDAFTSGSGMSQVDKLFDLSKNKDLSKSQRATARSAAYSMESQLLSLEKRSDKLAKSLEAATAKRDDLLSAQKGVQSSMVGAFDLGGLTGQTDKWGYQKYVGKKGLLSFGKSLASGAKKLSGKVSKLQKLGFNENMIQQVIDEWTQSGTFELADAMLSMNNGERKSFLSSFRSVEKYGLNTGESLTKAMSKGGIDAAQGLVDGLEKKNDVVENAFYKLGKNAEKAFRKSLDMHSPSRTLFKAGVDAGDGVELGLLSKVSDVESAAENLMTPPALMVPPSVEVSRYASSQSAPAVAIDYQQLAQAMSSIQLSAALQVSGKQAGTLVQAGERFNGTHK
ncbi:phage tail tape measure protein [Glutamicibacter sp. AOP5-A2-18]|uniref:phage tail tape measure protein n=1 Tax=Glutamicibacter sp. AOP5-A2-18 TaxID=3457656 RepID=UPI0040334AF6